MSSGGTNTVESQSAPPAQYLNAYSNVLAQAQNVAAQPLQQYSGQIVAPLSTDQNAGMTDVQNAQGTAQPYINQGASDIQASTAPIWGGVQQFSPSAVSQYESPYTAQVLGATEASELNTDAQQQQQVTGNAVSAGAWGGDRSGVAAGITAGQQALANNQTNAGILNQAYTQGLGEFNAQQQAQIGANEANSWLNSQAGYGMANLGQETENTALTGASALESVGGLQQAETQANLNVPYEQFLQQQAYPFQTTGWLANIAEGTGSASGGTSSTTSPSPSIISQLGGLGTAGLGTLGVTGAFGQNGYLSGANGLFNFGSTAAAGAIGTSAAPAAIGGVDAALGYGIYSRGGGIVPHRDSGGATPSNDNTSSTSDVADLLGLSALNNLDFARGGIIANDNRIWHEPPRMRAFGGYQHRDAGGIVPGDGADDDGASDAISALAQDDTPDQMPNIGPTAPTMDGGIVPHAARAAATSPNLMQAAATAVHWNESRGAMRPGIVGDHGASAGPMQVQHAALEEVNAATGSHVTFEDMIHHPEVGKAVGDTYLGMLMARYPGHPDYAIGAYNAGKGRMDHAIQEGQGIAGLPHSTQEYVANALNTMDSIVHGGDQGGQFAHGGGIVQHRDVGGSVDPDPLNFGVITDQPVGQHLYNTLPSGRDTSNDPDLGLAMRKIGSGIVSNFGDLDEPLWKKAARHLPGFSLPSFGDDTPPDTSDINGPDTLPPRHDDISAAAHRQSEPFGTRASSSAHGTTANGPPSAPPPASGAPTQSNGIAPPPTAAVTAGMQAGPGMEMPLPGGMPHAPDDQSNTTSHGSDTSAWRTLVNVGLGIMSGTSNHPLVNVGTGGLKGIALSDQEKRTEEQAAMHRDQAETNRVWRMGQLANQHDRNDTYAAVGDARIDALNASTALSGARAAALPEQARLLASKVALGTATLAERQAWHDYQRNSTATNQDIRLYTGATTAGAPITTDKAHEAGNALRAANAPPGQTAASTPAATQPPPGLPAGAKRAPDGNWYVPGPNGGWMRAVQNGG